MVEKYKRSVSTRKESGEAKLDPLIFKRKQFEIATSSNYNGGFMSAYRTKISPNRSL